MNPDLTGLLGLPEMQQASGGLLGADPNQPMPNIARNPVAAPTSTIGAASFGDLPMMDKLRVIGEHVSDGFQNGLGLMPQPKGLEGLLSPEDIQGARHQGLLHLGLSLLANAHGVGGGNAPSLGQALQAGAEAGQGGYQNSIDSVLKNRMTGMQLGMQQRIMQGRTAIGQMVQQSMQGSPDQQMAAMKQAYMAAVSIGDEQTANALKGVIEKGIEFGNPMLHPVDQGNKVSLVNPRTGQVVVTYPKTAAPMSDEARAFREQGLDMRREMMLDREQQMQAQREARHVGQYETMVKPFAQSAAAYQTLNELRGAAMHGDPIAQQTALQDFIRLNLPGQGVAQGEIHNYANLMGLGDKAQQMLQKLEKGTPLGMAQIKSIYDRADGLIAAKRKGADFLRKQAQARAAQYGIDPMAFVDHFGYLDAPGAQQAPATGAGIVDRHLNKAY